MNSGHRNRLPTSSDRGRRWQKNFARKVFTSGLPRRDSWSGCGRFTSGCSMPSSDRDAGLARLLLLICTLSFLWCARTFGADSPQEFLHVKTDPAGGVIATAHLLFPAGPEVIHALLTDFPRWPELFEVRMRVVDVQIRQDVATTDLRIEHTLLPGERRLVTESRTTANDGIVTDLVAGDFKRYHRVWKLSPANEGRETSADFEL